MLPCVRKWPGFAAAAAIAALALALYLAQPGAAPLLSSGTAVDSGPFRVTVKHLQPTPARFTLTHPANHRIIVIATFEKTGTQSWPSLPNGLRLRDVAGLVSEEPQVYLVRDTSTGGPLLPGLPEDLAFCWEQRAGTQAPAQATVDIPGFTAMPLSATGTEQWAPSGLAATVTVTAAAKEKA